MAGRSKKRPRMHIWLGEQSEINNAICVHIHSNNNLAPIRVSYDVSLLCLYGIRPRDNVSMIYSKRQLSTFDQFELEELIIVSYKGMRNTFLPAEIRKAHSINRDRAYVALERYIKS